MRSFKLARLPVPAIVAGVLQRKRRTDARRSFGPAVLLAVLSWAIVLAPLVWVFG